jgi:hypothetical protein
MIFFESSKVYPLFYWVLNYNHDEVVLIILVLQGIIYALMILALFIDFYIFSYRSDLKLIAEAIEFGLSVVFGAFPYLLMTAFFDACVCGIFSS